jgi:hypothetical protein
MMTARADSHDASASRWTRPMRPAPITPTSRMPSASFMQVLRLLRGEAVGALIEKPGAKAEISSAIVEVGASASAGWCELELGGADPGPTLVLFQAA